MSFAIFVTFTCVKSFNNPQTYLQILPKLEDPYNDKHFSILGECIDSASHKLDLERTT